MNINVLRPNFLNKEYNVLDFGAKSDNFTNNRIYFQNAIDECNKNGGGKVIIPSGYYLSGPIELKSNVNLFLEAGAYVKFIKSKEEYPLIWTEYEGIKRIRCKSPISAKDASNIAITGKGILDGNGGLWRGVKQFKVTTKAWDNLLKKSPYTIQGNDCLIWCPTETYYNGVLNGEPDYNDPKALEIASECYDNYRPVFVSLIKCDKVLIEGVTLMNSPAWNLHPLYCTNFTLKDAVIKNPSYAQNGDGLDLESCKNCEIVNTDFSVGDDGICVKSGKNSEARKVAIPTENVWIHDCRVFDAHGGFVVGSEMSRGVKNVLVENCSFSGTDIGIRFKSAYGRGGVVENIVIKNIAMDEIINEAIIFTMGYVFTTIEDNKDNNSNKYSMEDIPEFKDITMDNIICTASKTAFKVLGLPEKKIHDITLKNSFINAKKELDLSLCENIKIVNTTINNNYYKEEIFNN